MQQSKIGLLSVTQVENKRQQAASLPTAVGQGVIPESPSLAKQLSPYRDGEGKRTKQTPAALYLARSQVNAVRQELCTWDATAEDVSAKNFKFLSTRTRCQAPKPFMAPDALLLTAGGNDIRFAGAVGGTMLADKARNLLVQPFLYAGRKSLRLISARELASNAVELSPSYGELVDRVAEGALTTTAKTVLLAYPNPIGPDTAELPSRCYSDEIQRRVRSAFVAFSTSVRARVSGHWVVEFHPDEIRAFTKEAYPALRSMLAQSSAVQVDWLESIRDAAGQTDWNYSVLPAR